jgi:hypothetical protein
VVGLDAEVDELRLDGDPLEGIGEWTGVGPLGEQGPHHPLGLAVRLGSIRSRAAVAKAALVTGGREVTAPVPPTVVGEDPLDGDPVAGVEAPGTAQEARRRAGRLVGQLLGIGEPAVVIDRDVDPVPADTPEPALHPDVVDAVAATGTDPAQHLRVEMDELARPSAFVAHDRRSGFEPVEPGETLPAQDRVHARAGESCLPGEDVRPHPELASPSAQPFDDLGRVLARLVIDRARPVGEPAELGTMPPRRAGLAADANGPSRRRDRPARSDAIGQQPPTVRGQPGIRMGHRGLLLRLWLRHQQPRIGALSPSTT